jgi:hypothetical protein
MEAQTKVAAFRGVVQLAEAKGRACDLPLLCVTLSTFSKAQVPGRY